MQVIPLKVLSQHPTYFIFTANMNCNPTPLPQPTFILYITITLYEQYQSSAKAPRACLNYSCSLATALQSTGSKRSSHSGVSSGSVFLGTGVGMEVFTSRCFLGGLRRLPGALCIHSQGHLLWGFINYRQHAHSGTAKRPVAESSWQPSPRNNVSLQVELLVKSASTDRREQCWAGH